jgi:hypothetical protein
MRDGLGPRTISPVQKVMLQRLSLAMARGFGRGLRAWRPAVALALGLSAAPWALADGIKVPADAAWPTFQARVGITSTITNLGLTASTPKASMMGDYYFTGSGFDPQRVSGGFRATSGWLMGGIGALSPVAPVVGAGFSAALHRSPLQDDRLSASAGYVGVGYTSLHRSGFGFAADLGWVGTRLSPAPGAARLESDSTLRDIKLTPTVRLGVSYAF